MIEVKVDGHDLDEVRAKLKVTQDELNALRAVLVPSTDTKERIKHHVAKVG